MSVSAISKNNLYEGTKEAVIDKYTLIAKIVIAIGLAILSGVTAMHLLPSIGSKYLATFSISLIGAFVTGLSAGYIIEVSNIIERLRIFS